MMPAEITRDLMRRTIANLKYIEEHATDNGPYEVTQLVNSFLGALVHPWEELTKGLDKTKPYPPFENWTWPSLTKDKDSDKTPKDFTEALRHIRNGLAHGHVEFKPGNNGEIKAIRIWDEDPKAKRRIWGTTLTVEHMRYLLERFIELAEQLLAH